MKKKYMALITFIMLLIITIIVLALAITFRQEEFSVLYDKHWYRSGMKIYKNGILKDKNMYLQYDNYIILRENNVVEIVNVIREDVEDSEEDIFEYETKEYKYSYKDGIINMEIDDSDIFTGEFEISYNKEELKLIKKINNTKIVYYYEAAR